jgi:chemotaxis methyl-accepting protein methylase
MSTGQPLEVAVDRVAGLLAGRIGLRTEPTVRSRLRRSVRDEAADQGLDLRAYPDVVASDRAVFERLLDRITVQETSFFRHPEQFAVLVGAVLPTVRTPVRLWSAGCANGQEAFSLAMVLDEQGLDGSVVATDLSTAALRRTVTARYTRRELTGLSPDRLARYFVPSGDLWEAGRVLKERVVVSRHNLVDPLPPEARSCQVVFCRNVLIYLSHEHARAFLEQVADEIAPRALFVGSAEAIWPVTDRFDAVRIGDAFVHRPRQPSEPRPPAAGNGPVRYATALAGPAGGSEKARRGPDRHRPGFRPRRTKLSRPPGAPGPPGPLEPLEPLEPPGPPEAPGSSGDAAGAAAVRGAGQRALSTGDAGSAVVSFRKWAYLAPGDAVAQFHLGLALEVAGDARAAGRAYAVAYRLALASGTAELERATEGYARAELLRLLDLKQRELAP